ncbi:putative peroxidase [Actinacidiphila reveromycinica]|uniref:Putative peroxidase n=1 Tax=Actinacidiphila reveromycinica TaxID=659352 RepID=A0A7U3UNI3_9ACTN|nr:Dyp-type peroxidase [Streptomyces sp. SN-593]BBA95778.1 putative peroxidase [Streptomyces sp. SN-593]
MATEPEPQSVLSPLTSAAIFLVLTVEDGGEQTARELLADLPGLTRAIGFGAPDGRLSCVAGVGSAAWDRLFAFPRPADLHPFTPLEGTRHRAPATPGDLLLHLRATRPDLCFALATEIMKRLRGAVAVQDEVQGFKYLDVRDLLGFVDGTENPVGPAARQAVLVGAEDPEHAGGSYVIVQKYLHDLDAWNALPVEAQERIIGRTKATNIELDADDSHVALNTVTGPDGEEQDILRDNMPFGSPGRGEFGTYFIGYARTPDVTEQMLRNMFLGTSAASHDRILDFSTAVTGTLFYVPSADFLDDLPDAPARGSAVGTAPPPAAGSGPVPAQADAPGPARPASDGSLGIGNLNRSTSS